MVACCELRSEAFRPFRAIVHSIFPFLLSSLEHHHNATNINPARPARAAPTRCGLIVGAAPLELVVSTGSLIPRAVDVITPPAATGVAAV
jgi:hypothetical protein